MKPIPKYIALLLVIIGFYACASTGTPDGGPYDEEPPKFVRATPVPNSTNNTSKKVTIEFDEFIKLENASEKVIISPPQNESPEVATSGKKLSYRSWTPSKAILPIQSTSAMLLWIITKGTLWGSLPMHSQQVTLSIPWKFREQY